MDKYLKMFEPPMKRWLSEHYSPEEAKERWERTVALDEKWIREEGDLGGKRILWLTTCWRPMPSSHSMIR